MENIGICLPQPGYLEAVREITRSYGTLLIFDEVKTGITAGWGGATGALGVQPDLVSPGQVASAAACRSARSAARASTWTQITSGKVLHLGTYNGNPLVHGGGEGRARRDLHARGDAGGHRPQPPLVDRLPGDHRPAPACRRTRCSSAPRAASRGHPNRSATTATTRRPTSTSRSRSGSTASTAASCCRRASTSSGSISVMHTEDDAMHYADVFDEFVAELTG